jgi:uroporphyrinogen decarboxylase
MNSRERVLTAIRHQQPDQVPLDFGGTLMSLCLPEFLHRMREVLGYRLPPEQDADGTLVDEQIHRFLRTDLRLVPYEIPRAVLKDIDPPAYERSLQARSAYQAYWDEHAGIQTRAVMTHFPLAALSYEEVKANYHPRPREAYPPAQMVYLQTVARGHRANGYATTCWISSGLFEVGCWQRGYDRFLLDIVEARDMVRLMFERMLAARLVEIEQVVIPLAPYVDIFCFGDDLAMQNGPFISPRTFRELVAPYLAQMVARVKQLAPDAFVFHHSCGSVYSLLDDLHTVGADILNPTQVSARNMEPWRLKEKAAGKLCFHGGIDLQHVLPYGTPEEVRMAVEGVMAVLGKGGGYLCAPCHSLPEDVPVENILAMSAAQRVIPT